jgi:hypothetical protein
MPNKRMLFMECPPMAHDANIRDFRKMGFDIEVYQLLNLDKALDVKNKYRLEDFDVILIYISAGQIGGKDFIIPKELVDKLKKATQIAETRKSSPVRLVGMNLNLSGKEQQIQAEIFDGLFIGWASTQEQIMQCLGIY